jgi:uracil-DNA glycosylase family 4
MKADSVDTLDVLNSELVACRRCPRLVAWRELVATEKRASFSAESYWGRPAPNFGDPNADLLIVGLAPAAHGANRTGRMFTGDRSGDFLFAALHRAGLANQATSLSADDGLQLNGLLISASVHCAPPDNKPTPAEFAACRPYLERLIAAKEWRSILCLGGLAWKSVFDVLRQANRVVGVMPKFGHGVVHPGTPRIVASYHPSQQNTFTGRLTTTMFDEALRSFTGETKENPASTDGE